VLDRHDHLEPIADFLKAIQPMPAVFDQNYVKRLEGKNVKVGKTKRDLAEALRKDIRDFKARHGCDRLVVVWCASTEIFISHGPAHETLEAFERAMDANDPSIAPSMLYAWAAIQEGVPFANGAPNLTCDFPAMVALAKSKGVAIGGKDFKTGQTMVKTVLSPMFKARMLGVAGWYSTNILGNRDGEVLDDPESFKTKEESKLGVLDFILQPKLYPELYGDLYHKVRINYYPPRGDNKEGWDNIDIFGWLGYPMQIKVDFLCRDSILAAPLVLDLALFFDLSQRAGLSGIQEWLSFYFKSPQVAPGLYPEHDLFIQQTKLKNTLRYLMGEEQITHLGMEYYQEAGKS
jgi:myo-inositol-1-phosphate synthase